MSKSIVYCENKLIIAGDIKTWRLVFIPSYDLDKNTSIIFDMLSKGAPREWELPVVHSSCKKNAIWAELSNKEIIIPKPDPSNGAHFIFKLPKAVKKDEKIIFCLGTILENEEKYGNRSQLDIQRKRSFNFYIDINQKNDFKEKEVLYLNVKGGALDNLNIIVPSFVNKGKRFDVTVRFEDQYGNLTSNADENTLIDVTYEGLRENLCWKLFVPETGFILVPNICFNDPGIYRINLINNKQNTQYFSDPIKCFDRTEVNVFWGLLHGEIEKFDSAENLTKFLKCCRDENSLNFIAISPFENETTNEQWKQLSNEITEFNEDDLFAIFSSFQFVNKENNSETYQFVYLKENKPLLRQLDKIYRAVNSKEILAIPTFTMGAKTTYNFKDFNSAFHKVVEIYNAWGSSECSLEEGNKRPISGNKNFVKENKEGSIIKALNNNYRFGFIAGGLDDRGIYSGFYESGQTQYSPGFTAVIAKELKKEILFNAISNMQCYATTGAKILLSFFIANEGIGSQLNTKLKPGLIFNRYISGFVVGTTDIKSVEIIRNGKVLIVFEPDSFKFDYTFDDSENLTDIALESSDYPFVYYYVRVEQVDGHIAWSSPIWIDIVKENKAVVPKKNNKK